MNSEWFIALIVPVAIGCSHFKTAQIAIAMQVMVACWLKFYSLQGQSLNNRKDTDLRSMVQSREEALSSVEKLVQHAKTLEKKYTDKVKSGLNCVF